MVKDFKTIEQLVNLLESRGVQVDEQTYDAIRCESYYAIVNGYKDPFLDKQAMISHSDDVFKDGTQFRWIYSLFRFDRDLRAVTFSYLIKAEAIMKTAVVYSFCGEHQEPDAYLDIKNYCNRNEMLVRKFFKGNKAQERSKNIAKLMAIFNSKLADDKPQRDFVKHYLKRYGYVPLWVLSNDLTFGNIVHLYQLMKQKDRRAVCTYVSKATGRSNREHPFLSERDLLKSASLLVDFRNLCAHDERLYCARVGTSGYADMVAAISDLLPEYEFNDFLSGVEDVFDLYSDNIPVISRDDLLAGMGFRTEER